MATIPLQLASRSLDTGNVVQYPQGGEVGRALESAGNELQGVADHFKAVRDQQDKFDAGVVDDELRQRLAQTEAEAARNAPADGSGIHDTVYGEMDPATGQPIKPGAFDTLFDEYVGKVPESQRANFAATKQSMRLAGSNRLATVQYASRQAYESVQLTKSQDTLLNGILTSDPNDTKTFEAFKQNGLDRIASSGMSALDKEKAAYNWEQSATKGLFQSMLEKDPAFAGKARAALGLAPPPAAGDPNLPAGMRNNNPGNIKFVGTGQAAGVVGPSVNKDQGDAQAVFTTPEAGMRAAYDLAIRKYDGGKTTANQLIAGQGGWTPGNTKAAANIAATMGLGPDDDLGLKNPDQAAKFLRALVSQEHGDASKAYTDSMITNAVSGTGDTSAAAPPRSPGPDLPIVFGNTAGRVSATPDMKGIHPEVLTRFKGLQNALGESLPVVSGFRDSARNERAGGAKRSQHIEGNALDLDVSGKSQAERIKIIQTARAQGFGGIGVYANSIHIDTGPVRAWGASHHSDSLPMWARGALDGAPVGNAASQADPRFAGLSPEDRLAMANQADVQYRQQQATIQATEKADYTAYKDRFVLGIVQGQVTDPALISTDPKLNDGDKAYLLKQLNTENKGALQVQSDLAALNGNALSLDPYAADDKARADKLYAAAAGKVSPDQQASLASAIIQQTGVVPQPVMNSMRGGLSSQNPGQVVAAMQTAQKIAAYDPAALGRRDGGSEVQKAADDFGFYVNKLNLSPEDAARRLIDNASPDKQRDRKTLEPAAKEFVKTLADFDLAAEFDAGMFSSTPSLGTDPAQELGIKADFIAIAEDQFYAANGDPELAKNRALEQMKLLYGTSEMSGSSTVVKYPPEKYWPKQDSSGGPLGIGADPLQYAKTQLSIEIGERDEGYQPGSVRLVTTPETEADVKAGRLPGYSVLWRDANGNLQTIPGKVWRPDVKNMLETQQANRAKEQAEATEAARMKDMEIISGRDRAYGQENFENNGVTLPYTPERRSKFLKPEPGSNIPADIPAPDDGADPYATGNPM